MGAEPLFIDTGGFYALVSGAETTHKRASGIMEESRKARRRASTTDYVLDETATLLRARGLKRQLGEFFNLVEESKALSVEWMTPERFRAARGNSC